ncbi:hypothetical protein MKW94_028684 [Papaver nudicaule]|uniref:LEAF RUST 10 DISEASE-RESISTANCE LOCUS RECEPTOR-LIKE PROTEIN KINASE-like 1.2 n=1 Tax=Papaver nudicaule TaxID=74823 RepID=A0AA41SC91_PAPNU|nr:hypothetical protein [Papaver nudicaule]
MDSMFNVHLILLHIITFLTLVQQVLSADFQFEACKPKTCGNGSIIIKYPFWIQEDYCGQPGFGVTCKDNDPILHTSGYDYIIREIDYENKSFRVENPVLQDKECPVPFQNSTFSDQTPFKTGFNVRELSFHYNCSNYQPGRFGYFVYPVTSSCAKSSSDDKLVSFAILLFTPPKDFVMDPLIICQSLARVPIEMEAEPSLGPDGQDKDYMLLLKKGLTLGWDRISCTGCEESGGYCGFDKSSIFVCFCNDQPHYESCNGASVTPIAPVAVDKPTAHGMSFST